MNIVDTFDAQSEEIIKPSMTTEPVEHFPRKVLAIFSVKYINLILEMFQVQEISYMVAGDNRIPVYKFRYNGVEVAFYNTVLGGAASAALLEEVIAKGGEQILFFGSCGVLDQSIAGGELLVPTAAYRDEGTSYHYRKASDFIEIPTAIELISVFEELKLPYRRVKTWTTDAFYRETKNNMAKRIEMGCSIVEMECASVMAVGQFRNKKVYEFVYGADCLSGQAWDIRILGDMPKDMLHKIMKVALEVIVRL